MCASNQCDKNIKFQKMESRLTVNIQQTDAEKLLCSRVTLTSGAYDSLLNELWLEGEYNYRN